MSSGRYAVAIPAGTRVRLRHDEDRFPHFVAPAGALGTVVDVGDPQIPFAVRLDEKIEGAEDWKNEIHWFEHDACAPNGWYEVVDVLEGDGDAEQERAYEIASADVVLTLARADAEAIAEALDFLAGVDEGENTDRENLLRLHALVSAELPASEPRSYIHRGIE